MKIKQSKEFLISLLISSIYIAMYIYLEVVLNADVYLLMLNTVDIITNNKILYTDIFEINFPTIFLFNLIPYYSNFYFGFDLINIYIIEMMVLSYISFYIIIKISENTIFDSKYLIYILSLIIYISGMELGQREYIIIILMLPYVFLRIIQVKENNFNQNKKIIFFIIFLSSIGIMIKPFYVIVILFSELLFLILYKRNMKFLYIYTAIYMLFSIIYISIVLYLFPQYLDLIILFKDYSKLELLSSIYNFNFLILLLILFLMIKNKLYIELIYFTSFLLILILQNKYLTYHFIPSIMFLIFIINTITTKNKIYILLSIILIKVSLMTMYSNWYNNQIIDYNNLPKNTVIIDGISKKAYLSYKLKLNHFNNMSSTSFLTNGDSEFRKTDLFKENLQRIKKEINDRESVYILTTYDYYLYYKDILLKDFNISKEYEFKYLLLKKDKYEKK